MTSRIPSFGLDNCTKAFGVLHGSRRIHELHLVFLGVAQGVLPAKVQMRDCGGDVVAAKVDNPQPHRAVSTAIALGR